MLVEHRYDQYLHRLDPEVRAAVMGFIEAYPNGYDLTSPEKIRDTRARRARRRQDTNSSFPCPPAWREDRLIPGYAGDPDVHVRIYRRSQDARFIAHMLWIHGGAFVMGDAEGEDVVCARMAHNVNVQVVSVDYRLAPEHPHPAAQRDCYAAYLWLCAQSEQVEEEQPRIVVGGTSAGGGIAASLCQLLRDQKAPTPLLQVLAAPALDDRSSPALPDDRIDAPPFSRGLLANSWRWYLAADSPDDGASPYAAAARATDLSNLPPAYISIGALDPLLDENLEYARRLVGAGVSLQLSVYPGGCHGFESFAPTADLSQRCLEEREFVVMRAVSATHG